jgi:hypothetical protein
LREALGEQLLAADKAIDLDSSLPAAFLSTASKYELLYAITGIVFGSLCLLGGIILLYCGISGVTDFSISLLGFRSKLADASPGTILFVVGAAIIWVTRFQIKIRRK